MCRTICEGHSWPLGGWKEENRLSPPVLGCLMGRITLFIGRREKVFTSFHQGDMIAVVQVGQVVYRGRQPHPPCQWHIQTWGWSSPIFLFCFCSILLSQQHWTTFQKRRPTGFVDVDLRRVMPLRSELSSWRSVVGMLPVSGARWETGERQGKLEEPVSIVGHVDMYLRQATPPRSELSSWRSVVEILLVSVVRWETRGRRGKLESQVSRIWENQGWLPSLI